MPGTAPSRRWLQAGIVLAIIGLGFALRLYWALTIAPRQGSDARMYLGVAAALAAGDGYTAEGGPSAYYPIGYPLALAAIARLFGSEPVVARAANAVFAIATLLGIFGVTRAVTGSRIAAAFAALLFALYPADIGYTSVTLSQTFFNALSMLGCSLCLCPGRAQRWRSIAAGAALGYATLTRQQGAILVLLIVLGWLALRRHQRHSQALLVVAAFVATLAPWTVRNALALHAFVPVATNGGINLYIGNNPEANGRYKFTPRMEAQVANIVPRPWKGGSNEIMVDRLATRLALQYVTEHPRAALALWQRKFAHLFSDDGAFAVWSRRVPEERQTARLQRARDFDASYYRLLLALAAVGASWVAVELCTRRRSLGSMLWLPAAVIGAFTALHLATFGDPTYHHPMMPWFAIYAGYAVAVPVRAACSRLSAQTAPSFDVVR